ncbi:hypothetical protein ACJ73_09752, partial [Blastomyces percursus]
KSREELPPGKWGLQANISSSGFEKIEVKKRFPPPTVSHGITPRLLKTLPHLWGQS